MLETKFHKIAVMSLLPMSVVIAFVVSLCIHSHDSAVFALLSIGIFVASSFIAAVIEELISRHEQRRDLETRRRVSTGQRR